MKPQYNTWTKISASLSVWEILRLRQHRLWDKLANIPVGERGIESGLFLAKNFMQSPHIVSELLPPKESMSNKPLDFYPTPVKAQQHCYGFWAIFPHYVQSMIWGQIFADLAKPQPSPCGAGAPSQTPKDQKGSMDTTKSHKGRHLLRAVGTW